MIAQKINSIKITPALLDQRYQDIVLQLKLRILLSTSKPKKNLRLHINQEGRQTFEVRHTQITYYFFLFRYLFSQRFVFTLNVIKEIPNHSANKGIRLIAIGLKLVTFSILSNTFKCEINTFYKFKNAAIQTISKTPFLIATSEIRSLTETSSALDGGIYC